MGLYTQIVSGLLFPLHERLKGQDSPARLRALERSQWWPAERLACHRIERLRRLLVHAGSAVPYYRDTFARLGFEPACLEGLHELRRLPFLTKAIVREQGERLCAAGAQDLRPMNTGGSTGEPMRFKVGSERVSHDVAAKWRATRWWGVDIGDPELVLWGSPIEIGTQDRLRAWRDRLFRTQLISAFALDAPRMDAILAWIRRKRPKMLFGYPSALALIARHARERGVDMDVLGIEVAFVTAESLYDHQRALIAETFGCRVANGYGGRDAGFIAHECPAGRLHLSAEDIIVEIVDPAGNVLAPGASGEIVVTHTATMGFPFIRYRTGDIGCLDTRPCPCGLALPMLRDIQGRSTDFVMAADGTLMHGLALIYIVRDIPGVQAFKIIQEDRLHTRIQLVTESGFDEAVFDGIIGQTRARLGEAVRVDIERVESIPPAASGKYRYVESKVAGTASVPRL